MSTQPVLQPSTRESPRNSRTRALEAIREQIVSLKLLPGTRLSENKLAEELGLSRTPIRESLILLAEERLVHVIPQVGTVVAPILRSEIETAQFVRESIELTALGESMNRVSPQDIVNLNAIVDAQWVAESRGSLAAFFTLAEEFHEALMTVSGHSSAWRIVTQAKSHLDRAHHLMLTSSGMQPLIEEHQTIVDALAAGTADLALTAMSAHLRRVWDNSTREF